MKTSNELLHSTVTRFVWATILIFCTWHHVSAQSARSSDAAETSIREVIQRSIPFIESEGTKWITETKCITCHQVPSMLWSLNTARNRGFKLDESSLNESNKWAAEWINFVNPRFQKDAEEISTLSKENDAIAQLLLGRPVLNSTIEQQAWIGNYLAHLKMAQRPDGSWESQGQLPEQKRPTRETTEVSTMWALLAIAQFDDGFAKSGKTGLAMKWLGDKTVGISSEWWATKLLVARELGNEHLAVSVRQSLLSKQKTDGGWGWLCDEESDAFGTGLVLYALLKDGMTFEELPIENAVDFLLKTQTDDGSWQVNGTKEEFRRGPTMTATYWGTCWAVIGLLESIPAESAVVNGSTKKRITDLMKCQDDKEAVEIASLNYLEGFYQGDNGKLTESVDPSLKKLGYWKDKDSGRFGEPIHMTFEGALEFANDVLKEKKFPKANAPKKVEVIDVLDKIAIAKVEAWWGIDYVLLAKTDGNWRIRQVLWEGPGRTASPTYTDKQAVQNAGLSYVEGFYEGVEAKLTTSLKPTMFKYGYSYDKEKDHFKQGKQMTFDQAIDFAKWVRENNEYAKADAPKEVEVLDIMNNIAALKVTAYWGVDYLLLSRTGDKWMIEQVIWSSLPNK